MSSHVRHLVSGGGYVPPDPLDDLRLEVDAARGVLRNNPWLPDEVGNNLRRYARECDALLGGMCSSGRHQPSADRDACRICHFSGKAIVAAQGGDAFRRKEGFDSIQVGGTTVVAATACPACGYPVQRDQMHSCLGLRELVAATRPDSIFGLNRAEPPARLAAASPSAMVRVARAMSVVAELVEEREQIARALFASDERLLQFIERVADALLEDDVDIQRTHAALERAWERDELGKRTEALQRALIVQSALWGLGTDFYRWTHAKTPCTACGWGQAFCICVNGPTSATHACARDDGGFGYAVRLEDRDELERRYARSSDEDHTKRKTEVNYGAAGERPELAEGDGGRATHTTAARRCASARPHGAPAAVDAAPNAGVSGDERVERDSPERRASGIAIRTLYELELERLGREFEPILRSKTKDFFAHAKACACPRCKPASRTSIISTDEAAFPKPDDDPRIDPLGGYTTRPYFIAKIKL